MNPRTLWTTLLLLVLGVMPAACGDGDGANEETGICLTDEQICSLQVGVSTMDNIVKQFGPPTTSSMGTSTTTPSASYTCVQLDGGTSASYSQGVFLWFDADSVLTDVDVNRSGPEATPIPDCLKRLNR